MGPRYSSDGAVQAVVRAGAKKIAFDQSNVPGTGYIAAGPHGRGQEPQRADHAVQGQRADPGRELDRAQARAGRGHRRRRRAELHAARGAEDPPGRAAAGPAGPREGVGLLDAVQHGLRRQGARSAVGRQAARQRRAERDGRPTGRSRSSTARSSTKYGSKVTGGLGSFSQMGFTHGPAARQALQAVKGDSYTIKTVNKAIKNIKGFKTDILCRPWYYGDAPLHIPNNVDWTTTPKNGKMVIKERVLQRSPRRTRRSPRCARSRRTEPDPDQAGHAGRGLIGGVVRQVAQEREGVQGSECRAWRTSSHSWSPDWLWAACMRCPESGWWSSTGQPVC